MSISILYFAALVSNAILALASPYPQAAATSAVPLPGPGLLVNVTEATPISTNGTVGILTSLTGFSGCSAAQQTTLQEAYLDALNIVATVGGAQGAAGSLYANAPVRPFDWFGAFRDTTENEMVRIMQNYLRAQAPNSHWGIGDWWNDRYFTISCDDPGDTESPNGYCSTGATGYEVEPVTNKDPNAKYGLINFCPRFFTNMDNLATRVKNVEDGVFGFDKDDVRSLTSQGSAFLHEMMHVSNGPAGITKPRAKDVQVTSYPGKAYGPARCKQLARMTAGGAAATSINADNYVWYAVASYMYVKWGHIPLTPKHSWVLLSSADPYPPDNTNLTVDAGESIDSGSIEDDAEYYTSPDTYTPSGGYQTAGPTGAASSTEYIPVASETAADTQPVTELTLSPASTIPSLAALPTEAAGSTTAAASITSAAATTSVSCSESTQAASTTMSDGAIALQPVFCVCSNGTTERALCPLGAPTFGVVG